MQQGFHFNIPQDLVAKLREEQGFKDSKATGRQRIDPSKLTFLKGKGPKKSQSEEEEESKELLAETPSKQIQITEDWEDINDEMPLTFSIPKRTQSKELNSAGNFDGVEGEKIKATSEADGTNDDLWHSLPDYIDENEEPVIILNLRYLYGAGIPPAQAARLGRQLAETLHEDFAARAAELWELEDLCHHATTATEEAVAARLGRLHPADAFCRVRYPPGPLAGGPSARHLWRRRRRRWGNWRPPSAVRAWRTAASVSWRRGRSTWTGWRRRPGRWAGGSPRPGRRPPPRRPPPPGTGGTGAAAAVAAARAPSRGP